MSDWKARAACKGMELSLFFHPHGGRDNRHQGCALCDLSREACRGCDVREVCLHTELSQSVQHGVRGGLDARQREKLKAERRRKGWA